MQSASSFSRVIRNAINACCLAFLVATPIEGAAEFSSALADRVEIKVPRGGPDDFPLDWCYHAGKQCGQFAARAYCRSKGFDGAESFRTGHHIDTWIEGDQRRCHGPHCNAFIEISCYRIVSMKVTDPLVSGLRADVCRTWATDCGAGGALAFCKQRGFAFMYEFKVYEQFMGPTFVIGSKRRCDGDQCRALRYVECGHVLRPER